MNRKNILACIVIVLALTLLCTACAHQNNPWKDILKPAPGPTEAIGFYSKGCLKGAISLPADGKGFHVMRISRRRFYGHPDLIAFIRKLGAQAHKKKLGPLLLGDLSQPRGGPMLTGHASHQSGLDADIWFYQPKTSKEVALLDDRENLQAPNMITADWQSLDRTRWSIAQVKMLELAASQKEVERIFVNPVIKKELCATHANKPWLQKIRAWWGHNYHFHVRLKCPANGAQCEPQQAIGTGNGCDAELDYWFSAEAQQEAQKMREEGPTTRAMPELPQACDAVLELL